MSVGPKSDALMWAGMSSEPSSTWLQYAADSGTASFAHSSKSRRTSGEAFSFSVSEADVCLMKTVAIPTAISANSGTACSTSRVIR